MLDLRKQALRGGKTISRKARLRQASSTQNSRLNSAANSRTVSRAVSRHGSDQEDGNDSDGTAWSVRPEANSPSNIKFLHRSNNSIDDLVSSDDIDESSESWKNDLANTIDRLLDRKRSSGLGRQECLACYNRSLTTHYGLDEIQNRIEEIVAGVLKSVKSENGDKETCLALQALSITLITAPSDTIYDLIFRTLKRTIVDSNSAKSKSAAIHTLGVASFFGGAAPDEIQNVMDFFLSIIESDGNDVNAANDADVVVAALEEWGFLATLVEDLELSTEAAMDAFVEQLESSEVEVQIAAGENIALLYEKSFTPLEDDEEPPSEDDRSESDDEIPASGVKMIRRYTVYRREDLLRRKLSSLATVCGRGISKRDKKSLHSNFADILNSVEKPARGPRYQNAFNQDTGKRYGSRMKVRIHRTGEMKIDKWWKLQRLNALRRVLQGGFMVHYELNEIVWESLPIMISAKG